jgi:hypothetical protein
MLLRRCRCTVACWKAVPQPRLQAYWRTEEEKQPYGRCRCRATADCVGTGRGREREGGGRPPKQGDRAS